MAKTNNWWNISLGSIRNVPIRIHSSFLLLVLWVVASSEGGGGQAALDVLFLLAVFFCVLLHECGHVFTGQALGVKTKDITLYPFGGVATLLSSPSPKQELIIAVAGPLVSIILAGAFYLTSTPADEFLSQLFQTNLALAVFNLIPAIPMDGGRILRSILALCKIKSATVIAARISQGCSILLAIAGLMTKSPILVFIGVFVFFGAVQELVHARTTRAVHGKTVDDLMVERDKLYCFQHGTTLAEAVRIALRSLQEIFPVVYNDSLLGLVSRQTLIETISISSDDHYISGLAERTFRSVAPHTPLDVVLAMPEQDATDVIAVIDKGRFLGLVFLRNIPDVLIVDTFKNAPLAIPDDELI